MKLPQGTKITQATPGDIGTEGNSLWITVELPWGQIVRENAEISAPGYNFVNKIKDDDHREKVSNWIDKW